MAICKEKVWVFDRLINKIHHLKIENGGVPIWELSSFDEVLNSSNGVAVKQKVRRVRILIHECVVPGVSMVSVKRARARTHTHTQTAST